MHLSEKRSLGKEGESSIESVLEKSRSIDLHNVEEVSVKNGLSIFIYSPTASLPTSTISPAKSQPTIDPGLARPK